MIRSNLNLLLRQAPLLLALCAGAAQALDTPLAADTHVNTTLPANNFGSLPQLNIGGGATALLRFDLSTLPAGTTAAKLVKASLKLYVNRIGAAGAIEVLGLNGAWDEATVTASSPPPTAGAGSGVSLPVSRAGQFVSVDLTPLVRQWITSPATAWGVALQPALSAPATVVFLDSKENTATAHAATLDLTLADQGPAGPQGLTGAKGATGAQGPKGDTGPIGPPGLKGDTGAQGAQGATGAQGPKGDTGPAGATGVVTIRVFNGRVGASALVLPTDAYVFIGPTTDITTTAAQRLSSSVSLTYSPSTTAALRLDLCYRSSSGGLPNTPQSPGEGYKLVQAGAAGQRTFAAVANSFVPSAGSWTLGPCLRLNSTASPATTLTTGKDDWASGWVMVSNL
jgi:hypothetical protein